MSRNSSKGGKKGSSSKRLSATDSQSAMERELTKSKSRQSISTARSPIASLASDRNKKDPLTDMMILSPVNTARDNPAADLRNMRRIIAEDPDWTLATVPSLVELCVKHVVDNFANDSSILNKLLTKHRSKVLDKISPCLPLKVTAKLVDDDGYWKKCCKARWDVCDVTQHGGRWKRMFFERNLETIIEKFVPESTDPSELMETLALSSNYVRRLVVRQLLPPIRDVSKSHGGSAQDVEESEVGEEPQVDHFDFGPVLPRLLFLEEFQVTYGVRNCGMNFDWNLFQFTTRDCLLLSQCIANCRTLRTLKLTQSKVDDSKVRVLISHILDHPVLLELDLSHNIIGDHGARAIGKFLNNHSQLTTLNLCDNNIRAYGAQAIAHALTKNTTLVALELRLNHLGDEGGQAVCRALLRNTTLTTIGLGSNELTEPTAASMSQVIQQNSVLKRIDLSCNRLGSDGGKQLQEGMESNTTVTHIDLRLTECGQESEFCISQALSKNREKEHENERNKINLKK